MKSTPFELGLDQATKTKAKLFFAQFDRCKISQGKTKENESKYIKGKAYNFSRHNEPGIEINREVLEFDSRRHQ